LAIFVLAIAIRFLFIYQFKDSPAFGFYSADARHYDKFALKILDGNLFYGESVYLNPLYPFFLALVYKVFGHSLIAVAYCQALIDSLTVVLLYLIGVEIFKRRAVGVAASFIYACYGVSIFFAGVMTEATPAAFLFTASALLFAYTRSRPSPAWPLSAGLALGLAALLRPNIILIAPIAVLLLYARRTRTFAQMTICALLVAAGISLALAPFSARNYAIAKTSSPFSANGGISFYIGNNRAATGFYVPLSGVANSPVDQVKQSVRLASSESGRRLSISGASAYWSGRAFRFIVEDPVGYMMLTGRKIFLFWNKVEIPANENYRLCMDLAQVLRRPLFSFGVIAPFALIGIFKILIRKESGFYLIPLCVLGYMISLVLFYVTSRYRFPCVPLIAVAAAYGVDASIGAFRRPGLGPKLLIVTAIAASSFFVNADIPEGPVDDLPANHNNLGIGYYETGEFEKAVLEYQKALAIDPGYARSHVNLASAYYRMGKRPEAIASYEMAISLDPALAEAHYALGNIYSDGGEYDKASKFYAKTIEADPGYVEAYSNLAYAYMGMGRYAEAEEACRSVMTIDPSYAPAYNNLGILCARSGRISEAAGMFRKALELRPGYDDARKNLEKALGGDIPEEGRR
jgi:Tfp pilus assembly protein PilF/4-amino-4-deoxy-L-arabinose transferase-like glycosyltransferase